MSEESIMMSEKVAKYGMQTQCIPLSTVKNSLRDALRESQERIREEKEDNFFSIYSFIEEKLGEGFSQSSVRKWENTFNPLFPPIDHLLKVCKLIKNNEPLYATVSYIMSNVDE